MLSMWKYVLDHASYSSNVTNVPKWGAVRMKLATVWAKSTRSSSILIQLRLNERSLVVSKSFFVEFILTTGALKIKLEVDEEGTCARNICECDRRLAESLYANKDTYNQQYHTLTNDGAWAYNNQCQRRNANQKYGKATECCGESFPDMIPKQEVWTAKFSCLTNYQAIKFMET